MAKSPGFALPPALAAEVLSAIARSADVGRVGLSLVAQDVEPPEHVFFTPGTAEMLGYTPEEFALQDPRSHFSAETLAAMRDRQVHVFDGTDSSRRLEVWLRRKDGTQAPFEITTGRAEVGGRPVIATILHDVSARVDAAKALAASETRFRTAVENAPDGVVILRGTTVVYANTRAAQMLGYETPTAVVGHPIFHFLRPADGERARSRIQQIVRTGERFPEPTEYHAARPDNRETTVEISSIPMEFEGAPAVLAFARDVTERKAMQEKMVQADRLAAVGTLAAGIAHEINNPLAYVLLGLQYLERELPKLAQDPTRLADALARLGEVRHGAERVGVIVRDLKTFARADEVARGPVDVRDVVEAAIKIADNEIRHRAMLVRAYEQTLPVHGNAVRLEQVFLNLLVNAAHAVSDRTPASSEVKVVIRSDSDRRVIVEISDNGPGIAPDVLSRVFDPFFTTKAVGVGTGLGLPICRSIIESFGGTIELDSVPGSRTTARVSLPVHLREDAPRAEAAPARMPSSPPAGRSKILIVDDEPLVGALLRRMLSGDHDVTVATSAPDALLALERGAFDAILCDVMMPGMTGMDLYAALREKAPHVANRMVFMTGGAFVPKVAEFLAAVENPKLEKPFELSALAAAFRELARLDGAARAV
jgi:PAS domain S-box-containing protein